MINQDLRDRTDRILAAMKNDVMLLERLLTENVDEDRLKDTLQEIEVYEDLVTGKGLLG